MQTVSTWKRIQLGVTDRFFCYVTVPFYLRKIRPGDVVIDLGANIGKFAERFAKRGATVYAFEPHPVAFAALTERLGGNPNVHCINKAVSSAAGEMKLYLRPDDDSIAATESSSLMAVKDNISTEHFVDVEVIRLVDFIKTLGRVRFLKMDIEGAEYDVLGDLLDNGMVGDIDFIVVETHERSPGLRPRHEALVSRIEREKVGNVDLNWH